MFTKQISVLLVLTVCAAVYVDAKCERNSPKQLKRFKIDLDAPPKERFKESALYFKDGFLEYFNNEAKNIISPTILSLVEYVANGLDKFFPYPFNEEVRGIAEALKIQEGEVILANLVYEITAYCTSIVAMKEDGHIIHGRNLDYDFSGLMQNISFIAEYHRDGKLLFTTVQVAGYLGILTGHKQNSFTFSLNERDQGSWLINLLFALIDRKATPIAFLTRSVMENQTDFESAVSQLKTTDLIAPVYFIVGGMKPYEGVVLTRDQGGAVDEWRLDASSSGIESWYLLETNYDHWVPPPQNDNRRTPGMKAMNATTQANINLDTLLDVLTINPVCNGETVYSAVMSAAGSQDDAFKVLVH